MKLSRRGAWLLILLGVGLLVGLLFRAFIVANVIVPIAMMILLIWRLLMSVHQAIYWGAVIALAMAVAFYRLFKVIGNIEEPSVSGPPSVLKDVDYWGLSLRLASDKSIATTSLKQELRSMLVEVYALKRPETVHYAIHEALRRGQLPLPDTIYNFLFDDEAQKKKLSWREWLRQLTAKQLLAKPGNWLRHWTGREKVEYYQAVEETITYMEELMEIKNGDDYFDPSND